MNKYLQSSNSIAAKSRGDVDSIDTDIKYQFSLGKLNYTNFTKDSKPYVAVVSLSGEKGTFRNIQSAINYASSVGGGAVFIKNGTYIVDQNITLFDGVSLVGESGSNTIIDFNSQPYQITAQGTAVSTDGTFSVNNNSTTVTGSGTSWTTALEGEYLLVKGSYLMISTVSSTTSLTLSSAYSGDNLSGEAVLIATPTGGISISNITVQNSTAVNGSLYFKYTSGITLDGFTLVASSIGLEFDSSDLITATNWGIFDCGSAFVLVNCSNIAIDSTTISNCTSGDGFSFTNCNVLSVFNFSVFGASGRGIYMSGCYNYGVLDFTVISCTGIGLEMLSTYEGQVTSGNFLNNTTDAIRLTSSNLRNTFATLTIRSNGGWGINVASSTNVNNLILGDILASNTSGAVTDSGTTTKIRSCIGQADN